MPGGNVKALCCVGSGEQSRVVGMATFADLVVVLFVFRELTFLNPQVQTAVDTRTVEKPLLIRITAGMWVCAIMGRLLKYAKNRVTFPLRARLKQHYSLHLFHARARLDVPTFDDPAVQRQLDSASHVNGQSVAWGTFTMLSGLMTTVIKIVSQIAVLATVLKDQQDGPLLAVVSFAPALMEWVQWQKGALQSGGGMCSHVHVCGHWILRRRSMGCHNEERGLREAARP